MSTTIERLKSELTTLSPEERAELAHFLIQTLDLEPEEDVEEAWKIEVKSRVDEILSGKVTGRPAEQVFAEIRARHA